KTLDNGINIEDEELKNIVIMAYDKTTFIQMLGRKRIDINNAQTVNLYINTRYKKSFSHKLLQYNKKQKEVELHQEDENLFNRKYDNDLRNLGKLLNDLFYRGLDGKWKLNIAGLYRLVKDKKFAEYMIKKFDTAGEFAFITEQLSWLGLGYTFDESNLTGNIILNEDVIKLEDYLKRIVGKKLFSEEQEELTKKIIYELLNGRGMDYRTKKLKPSTLEKILRDDLKLNYIVNSKKDGNKSSETYMKRYWIISNIV
ncbi:MAG TPA: hypothetical protein DDY71_09860, partial [Spirochaetia bacterium]|nr:hypothetical protein [Spirochaetia bacterium]